MPSIDNHCQPFKYYRVGRTITQAHNVAPRAIHCKVTTLPSTLAVDRRAKTVSLQREAGREFAFEITYAQMLAQKSATMQSFRY